MNVRINEDLQMNYLPVWTSHRLVRALPGRERRPGCLDQRAELGLGSTSSESAGKDLSSYTIVSPLFSHPTLSEYSYLLPP